MNTGKKQERIVCRGKEGDITGRKCVLGAEGGEEARPKWGEHYLPCQGVGTVHSGFRGTIEGD